MLKRISFCRGFSRMGECQWHHWEPPSLHFHVLCMGGHSPPLWQGRAAKEEARGLGRGNGGVEEDPALFTSSFGWGWRCYSRDSKCDIPSNRIPTIGSASNYVLRSPGLVLNMKVRVAEGTGWKSSAPLLQSHCQQAASFAPFKSDVSESFQLRLPCKET